MSPACQSLGVSQLDSVIIAPPPLAEEESLSVEHIQPLWGELQALVHNQKIAAIGTSDLDKVLLEQLYSWAEVCVCSFCAEEIRCCLSFLLYLLTQSVTINMLHDPRQQNCSFGKPCVWCLPLLHDHVQVKPSSNQVNLASCCVMPPDLTAFAKEFNIQLLTHNDPKGKGRTGTLPCANLRLCMSMAVVFWQRAVIRRTLFLRGIHTISGRSHPSSCSLF